MKKSVRRRNKKHSRTSPDVKVKEFSLTIQKLDLEWTMSKFGKSFLKKSDKNRKIKSISKYRYREQKSTSQTCKFDYNKKLGLE